MRAGALVPEVRNLHCAAAFDLSPRDRASANKARRTPGISGTNPVAVAEGLNDLDHKPCVFKCRLDIFNRRGLIKLRHDDGGLATAACDQVDEEGGGDEATNAHS